MSLIQVSKVSKIFGSNPEQALGLVEQGLGKAELLQQQQHALGLYDINLNIEAGEVFVIMGLSGSGKSTLIRHFNRLINPTSGEIIVDGQNVTALNKQELRQFRREQMSMVFQHFGLLPHRNVLQNAAYALKLRKVDTTRAQQQARDWLERVGLAGFEKQYPQQLSGGQQQRVGLARALAADTNILLMDEAFSALDPLIRTQMQDELLVLQQQLKKTVIFITHDLSEALRLGTRIAILNDGRLAQVGSPEQILLQPADDYVREFVKGVDLPSTLGVEAIMRAPNMCLDNCSLQQAKASMTGNNLKWAWLQIEGKYRGLVTLAAIENALAKTGSGKIADIAVKRNSVELDSVIARAVPAAIGAQYPIAVIDADGKLSGVIDISSIGELYAANG